jgi:large subunit ribosomal protein L10
MTTVGRLFREKMVNRVKDGVDNNSSVFLLNYTRVTSNQLSGLRKDLRRVGAHMHVARNTITHLALKELKHEDVAQNLDGQTAIVWSNADSVEVSKLLVKFAEAFDGVVLRGGLLDKRILKNTDVKRLSDLPSREVLLSQLLAIIQAPVTQLLGALNAKTQDVLSILKQLSEKKQKEGGS